MNMAFGDFLVRCTKVVEYNGTEFGMSGFALKIPEAANVNVQIGEVEVKNKLIRAVVNMAAILDLYQYTNCQNIKLIPKDSPSRAELAKKSAEIFERLGTLQGIIEIAGIIGSGKSDKIENMFLQWLSSTLNLAPADSPVLPTVKSFVASDEVISKNFQAPQQRFTITDALASL
jgi:hypothetical protein